jgi:hypothetical protein
MSDFGIHEAPLQHFKAVLAQRNLTEAEKDVIIELPMSLTNCLLLCPAAQCKGMS